MTTASKLQSGFQKVLDTAALPIRIRQYTETTGSVWDDDVTLTTPVDTWTSGVVLPINTKQGSFEANLVEQGKLVNNDSKLYVSGNIAFVGDDNMCKIGIGSPPTEEYSIVPLGVKAISVQGINIFRKAYIRQLPIGSLAGEM